MAPPTSEQVIAIAMAAGAGYNTGATVWPVGRRGKRSPNRAEIRALKSRRRRWLGKHGRSNPDLAAIGQTIELCGRSRLHHRCGHPGCPRCADALQRLLVRVVSRYHAARPRGETWVTVSIILPVEGGDGHIDFLAWRRRCAALLREVGISLGVFGLDLSWNEDHRHALPEAEWFAPHACVHLYGLAPVAEVEVVKAKLKRRVQPTMAVPRPVQIKFWDGGAAAIAYLHKPDFQRRQTIEKFDEQRGKLVRDTRDRPLTVEQQIRTIRALERAGLTGRLMLVGLRMELGGPNRLRLVPSP